MATRKRAGRVELAVRRDLKALGEIHGGSALAELALVLARAVDGVPSGGPLTTVAKLVGELRVTLGQLREVSSRDGDSEEEGDGMSTPVWDASHPGSSDVGATPSGGGSPSG